LGFEHESMHPYVATRPLSLDPASLREGSGAAICLTVQDLASLLRRAPALPHVLWL
jgi:hypothetical protein